MPEELVPENDLMRNMLENLSHAGQMTLHDALVRLNEAAIKTIQDDPVLSVLFGMARPK